MRSFHRDRQESDSTSNTSTDTDARPSPTPEPSESLTPEPRKSADWKAGFKLGKSDAKTMRGEIPMNILASLAKSQAEKHNAKDVQGFMSGYISGFREGRYGE